jgi:hypothetical protein
MHMAPKDPAQKPTQVNIRGGYGIQFEGEHKDSDGNPHTFPAWFAQELIHSNRASLVGDDDEEIENGDPDATNGDPSPRGRRRK